MVAHRDPVKLEAEVGVAVSRIGHDRVCDGGVPRRRGEVLAGVVTVLENERLCKHQ